jgi:orotate phosphoribosyltransferase
MTRDEILSLLRKTGALVEGHFVREDGLHTSQLIRPAKALQFAPFNRKLSFEIVRHFLGADIHVILSPTVGGIPVAVEVGRQLEARAIFIEQVDGVATLGRGFELHEGERVVVATDLLASDAELADALGMIRDADARLVGIGSIVDIREVRRIRTAKDIAAIQLADPLYPAESCPLCASEVAATLGT